jgi:hypothetical protein
MGRTGSTDGRNGKFYRIVDGTLEFNRPFERVY